MTIKLSIRDNGGDDDNDNSPNRRADFLFLFVHLHIRWRGPQTPCKTRHILFNFILRNFSFIYIFCRCSGIRALIEQSIYTIWPHETENTLRWMWNGDVIYYNNIIIMIRVVRRCFRANGALFYTIFVLPAFFTATEPRRAIALQFSMPQTMQSDAKWNRVRCMARECVTVHVLFGCFFSFFMVRCIGIACRFMHKSPNDGSRRRSFEWANYIRRSTKFVLARSGIAFKLNNEVEAHKYIL